MKEQKIFRGALAALTGIGIYSYIVQSTETSPSLSPNATNSQRLDYVSHKLDTIRGDLNPTANQVQILGYVLSEGQQNPVDALDQTNEAIMAAPRQAYVVWDLQALQTELQYDLQPPQPTPAPNYFYGNYGPSYTDQRYYKPYAYENVLLDESYQELKSDRLRLK